MIRNICFLLIVCASSIWASETKSQIAKASISKDGATILDIIHSIENQTDYLFVYDKSVIDETWKVNIHAVNKSVAEVLSEVLEKTNTIYAMEGTNIFLMTKTRNPQQQNVITGTVVDANGSGLPGVNIRVVGTTIGVMTDINGKYSLSVPDNNATLELSFIGYITQNVQVAGRINIDIVLVEDTQLLKEVVVVGYGTQAKKDITGAVSVVTTESLAESASVNVAQALQGKSSGVYVSTTGAPGSNSVIRVRGVGSVNGSDPLVIIDGVSGGNMNSVSPYDLESFQVLKDASATAIYGARAANGVVLITTKRGKKASRKFLTTATIRCRLCRKNSK